MTARTTLSLFRRYIVCALGSLTLSTASATYWDWADDHFSDLGAAEAAPGADPDNDSISNLREYAFNLDPLVSGTGPETGGMIEHNGEHFLFLRFPRRTDAPDLTFEVRSQDAVYDLCDGEIPYLWESGAEVSAAGLISTDNSTSPPTLTLIDKDYPLEDNIFRGFLQLFIVLESVEEPIDFVTVGDPGNPGKGGVGSVDYEFQIGQCEITNDQYCEFLNATAAEDNWTVDGTTVAALFNPGMEDSNRGGIRRHGEQGAYTYSVKPVMGNKPVVFVSYFSACRYCNWLHNGKPQPRCRRMNTSTTEDGVYDMTDRLKVFTNQVNRKPGALYFLPTQDEWYKAAAYDPTKPGSNKYWVYGTRSDAAPQPATATSVGDIGNPSSNVANFLREADWDSNLNGEIENDSNAFEFDNEDGNLTTVASGGPSSYSYYGAADMSGSALEWTESAPLAEDGSNATWGRYVRGGSWKEDEVRITAAWGGVAPAPITFTEARGFRVCRQMP